MIFISQWAKVPKKQSVGCIFDNMKRTPSDCFFLAILPTGVYCIILKEYLPHFFFEKWCQHVILTYNGISLLKTFCLKPCSLVHFELISISLSQTNFFPIEFKINALLQTVFFYHWYIIRILFQT